MEKREADESRKIKQKSTLAADLDDSVDVAGEDVGGDVLVADFGEHLQPLLAFGLLAGLLVGRSGHGGADPLATQHYGRIRVQSLQQHRMKYSIAVAS